MTSKVTFWRHFEITWLVIITLCHDICLFFLFDFLFAFFLRMQSGERLLNHTHGPFDLLHFENINFLEAASLFI